MPGGEDYEPLSKQLVFKKSTTKYTVNVSIINDNIIDHNETFLAHLTLVSPLDESDTILLSPNSTEVRIKDNDSKYTCLFQCFTIILHLFKL